MWAMSSVAPTEHATKRFELLIALSTICFNSVRSSAIDGVSQADLGGRGVAASINLRRPLASSVRKR
jgi:hypothetical protein